MLPVRSPDAKILLHLGCSVYRTWQEEFSKELRGDLRAREHSPASSFRWRNRAFSLYDLAIRFGAAIAGEVEQRLFVVGAHVQIYACSDQLVSVGNRLGHDLPGGSDDAAVSQQLAAFFGAAFGCSDHPHAVLISTRLHHEVVVECLQRVLRGIGRVVERGVVADEHQFRAAQPHDPISLRPAAIVADGHAYDAAERTPDLKTFSALLEISPFKVLEPSVRFVVFVARYVHLAELAYKGAVSFGEDGRVEAVSVGCQFGIAEVDADAELGCFCEKLFRGCARRARVFGFVEAVEFRFVFKPPAWEEGGEGQLWIDKQLYPLIVRLMEKSEQTLHDFSTGFAASYRPELRNADRQLAGHDASLDGNQSSDFLPGEQGVGIACGHQIEHHDRQVVFHAECDGCGVHGS